LPEYLAKFSTMGWAFSFFNASPVMITAPVSISSGIKPASR
jgi:hypothetical protein